MQVSAFGSDTETDSGDVWTLVTEKGTSEWLKDHKVQSENFDQAYSVKAETLNQNYGFKVA